MLPINWKTFLHPAGVYRLEYPAHWDQAQKDDARSCGFGPHDRDDVGLWISLMPVSVDSDRLAEELPKILSQALPQMEGGNVRRDPTLRHYAVKADVHKEGEGGHFWMIAGGDVVLFASSQLPAAECHIWNPIFERLMATLEITRDEELALRQLTNEVLPLLRQRHPEQDFQLDEKGIRGRNCVVYLSNLHREVRAAPARRAEIIQHFVQSLGESTDLLVGAGVLGRVQARLLPLLKPRSYLNSDSAARHALASEWLADVVICYALRSKDIFRFVTVADLDRWQTDAQALHEFGHCQPVPAFMADQVGRGSAAGRWAYHHHRNRRRVGVEPTAPSRPAPAVLRPPGSPFRAGIPDRDTLVVYSDRRRLRHRTERQLRKDHRTSGYPITPRPFLVTPDGIAPAPA